MELTIVIDAQNDNAKPASLHAISRVVEKAVQDHNQLLYTMNVFNAEESDHFILDTYGCDIAREALPKNTTYPRQILWKRQANCDWSTTKLSKYKKISIVGYYTDTSVITNALILHSYYPDIPICVYSNACEGTNEVAHLAALLVMKNCGIIVKEDNTDDTISE